MNQKKVNRNHARTGHPANAPSPPSRPGKLLTKLRCCPRRAATIIAAIRVLQTVEDQGR
jgi:hypothetical protein